MPINAEEKERLSMAWAALGLEVPPVRVESGCLPPCEMQAPRGGQCGGRSTRGAAQTRRTAALRLGSCVLSGGLRAFVILVTCVSEL